MENPPLPSEIHDQTAAAEVIHEIKVSPMYLNLKPL